MIRETRQAGTLSPVELIEQRLGDRKRHSESLSDGIFGHKTRRRRSREREYCHKCISKRFMGCVLVRTFLHYCHHGLQRFVRIYESPCDTWCSLLGRRDSPLCLTGSVATTAHNLSSSTSFIMVIQMKRTGQTEAILFFKKRVNVWSKLVDPQNPLAQTQLQIPRLSFMVTAQ